MLKCLAIQFEECGYVQGLGFVSGMLMTYVTPEDCFCMMNSFYLNDDYAMKPLYLKGMPGLELCFYTLLSLQKKYMPKLLAKMIEVGFLPQMYASQWFLTLFAVYFEIEVVVRIWDIFLVEGKKTIYRVGLAILKILEKKLMAAELGDMFTHFRDFRTAVDTEQLLKTALDFTFSRSLLDKFAKEYHSKSPNKEILGLSKLL